MYVYFIDIFYRCIIFVYIYLKQKHVFIFSFTEGNVYGLGTSSSYHVICSVLGGHFSFPLFELLASDTRSLSPSDSGLEVQIKLHFQCFPVVHSS